MDSSFIPTLGWIIIAVVTVVLWRSEPMMARIGVMGASGSLGLWLLQHDWPLVGGMLFGVGIFLLVYNGRTLFRDPTSLKHPTMILGIGTLVMLAAVGVIAPNTDDKRLIATVVVLMLAMGAAFLMSVLVLAYQVTRKLLRERTQ